MISILRVVSLMLFFLPSFAHAAAPKTCVEQANQILTSKTDRLIAYLGQLVETHVIGEQELSRFLGGLERNQVENPISEEDAESNLKRMIHREGLERIIQGKDFDLKRLEEWARKTLETRGIVQNKRNETRDQSKDTYQKIKFVPVSPGRFQMGEKQKMDVTLTHPFEVMSTSVTQKQWVDLMGENPSKFFSDEDVITVTVNSKSVKMQPDNPVAEVTWWSVLVYANKLSEKHGLKPAYDLSQVVFKPDTRAENGTLDVEGGELKIAAPNGNIYEAKGYRLPTEAEQEFLLRTARGNYYFGSRVEDPNGRVWEWSQDWYDDLPTGAIVNPTGPTGGTRRIMRGGHIEDQRYTYRNHALPSFHDTDTGFRIVRTMPSM